MAILDLEWKVVARHGLASNPMLSVFQSEVGTDDDGLLWLCRVQYLPNKKQFEVEFDNVQEYEVDVLDGDVGIDKHWSEPFLRPEVIYAKDFWGAKRRYFRTQYCNYEDIESVIRKFAISKGTDLKDVTGKPVR